MKTCWTFLVVPQKNHQNMMTNYVRSAMLDKCCFAIIFIILGYKCSHNSYLSNIRIVTAILVIKYINHVNCHPTFPENLPFTNCLAMLIDEKHTIREFSYMWRTLKQGNNQESIEWVLVLNFEAVSYIEMIDWQKSPITEPQINNARLQLFTFRWKGNYWGIVSSE